MRVNTRKNSSMRKRPTHSSVVAKSKTHKSSEKEKKRELQAKYVAKLSASAQDLTKGA
jgi:hypothetical protein